MNEVLLFLLKSREPLLDPIKLPQLLKLNRLEWTNFVDEFRGMIITSPGMVCLDLHLFYHDMTLMAYNIFISG